MYGLRIIQQNIKPLWGVTLPEKIPCDITVSDFAHVSFPSKAATPLWQKSLFGLSIRGRRGDGRGHSGLLCSGGRAARGFVGIASGE